MTLQEFRIAHSTVMEHYQFIEMHLEGIYAVLSKNGFIDGLENVRFFSISKTIQMIQNQEKRLDIRVISDSEYEDLNDICQRRNFWTHSCYTDMAFDSKTDGPKKEADIKQLHHDIRAAEQMREILLQKKINLMHTSAL